MNPDTKKKIVIGLSIGAVLILGGILIKKFFGGSEQEQQANKPAQTKPQQPKAHLRTRPTQPKQVQLPRQVIVKILKHVHTKLKDILASVEVITKQTIEEMRKNGVDPVSIRKALISEESIIRAEFEKRGYVAACAIVGIKYADFQRGLNRLLKTNDPEIRHLVEGIQKGYKQMIAQDSKSQKNSPNTRATISKQKFLEIYKKLALKKNLVQVDIFRKVRGRSQQQLLSSPQLLATISRPNQQQITMLIQQGLGPDAETASSAYNQALTQYKNEPDTRTKIHKIDSNYASILSRYQGKMKSNKITEDELNQLEDQLIYSDHL